MTSRWVGTFAVLLFHAFGALASQPPGDGTQAATPAAVVSDTSTSNTPSAPMPYGTGFEQRQTRSPQAQGRAAGGRGGNSGGKR